MYARAEVAEQYKQAVREYIRHTNDEDISFQAGKMLGLKYALMSLGVNDNELNTMYFTCEEEVENERPQEDEGGE